MKIRPALKTGICLMLIGVAGAQAQELPLGWDLKSSVTLRGGIEHQNDAFTHFIIVEPEVLFERADDDFTASLRLGGEIDQRAEQSVAPRSLFVEGDIDLRLNRHANVEFSANYNLSQERAEEAVLPGDVIRFGHGQQFAVSGAYNHQFSYAGFQLRAGLSRAQLANDLLLDNSYQSNRDQNFWQANVGARISRELTPRISVFIDGDVSRQKYDAPSASLAAYRDNWSAEARAGLRFNYDDIWVGEASAGTILQEFDDTSFGQQRRNNFAAEIDWRLSRTGTLSFNYNSESSPTQRAGEVMEITDAGRLSFDQRLNSRWSANGFGAISRSLFGVSGDEIMTSSVGLGISYQANEDLRLFANYVYELREETAQAVERTHRIETGVRFNRP